MWAFEGSVPGPTIEAERGRPVRVEWRNELDGALPVLVTVALAETDGGGFMDFLNTLLDRIDDRVTALLSTAAGAAVGTAIGTVIPGIGNLVGAVVGAAVGALIGLLKTVAEDDILGAETVSVEMGSPSHRFDGNTESPQGVKKLDGHHSSYEVRYSWRLYS